MPNYDRIIDRAAEDGDPVTVTLSAKTLFLLLDLLDEAAARYRWFGYTVWDDVEQMIATANSEVQP